MPTIHSWIGITSAGGPALHNPEFTDATMTDFAAGEMLSAAVAMAQTGYQVITEPELLQKIRLEFESKRESRSRDSLTSVKKV